LEHLPERDRPAVKRRLRRAWACDYHWQALEHLQALAGEFERSHPGAAASLREGFEGDAHHHPRDHPSPAHHRHVEQPASVITVSSRSDPDRHRSSTPSETSSSGPEVDDSVVAQRLSQKALAWRADSVSGSKLGTMGVS
jgi:hypothetical protein